MHRLYYFILSVVSIGIISCSSDNKVDSKAVRAEIKSREIIKITDAELLLKVHEIGKDIALKAKKTLGNNLKHAIAKGGIKSAIEFCNLNAMPLIDSVQNSLGVETKRVSLKARNHKDVPNKIEKEILEAYVFELKNDKQLKSNVQEIGENRYLFNLPILIDNPMCLTCHGSKENGLTDDTHKFIKSIYPTDEAIDYQLGDLRGMWSITIPKKKVVQSFYQ